MKKIIEVNNGRNIEINFTNGGCIVTTTEDGKTERRDSFDDGEITMAINLLRYMRDEGMKSVYLFNRERRTDTYLSSLISTGDIEDFRIFQ